MPHMGPSQDLAEIVEVEDLGRAGARIRLAIPGLEVVPQPGQFAMLRPGLEGSVVFLGRPISYLDAARRPEGGVYVDFYIKVYGPGSAALVGLKVGDFINHLGPLGRGFEMPGEPSWLVGGGVGIAPFHHLVSEAARQGVSRELFQLYYGGRVAEDLPFLEQLKANCGHVVETTEDGSLGLHGRVTDALGPDLGDVSNRPAQVMTCGPTPMMKAVAELSHANHVSCFVSLETRMACGYGVCLGCVVHVEGKGYVRACIEGPVLPAEKLNFEERWL
jgi:dihydroorotate dehydrogenase electron transfer subunit